MAGLSNTYHYESAALILATAVYGASFVAGVRLESRLPAIGGPQADLAALTFGRLWLHNVLSLAPLWAGMVSFGGVTLLWLVFQGLAHGSVVAGSGLPLAAALLRLLPHGLFEIAAILLAGAAGLSPGVALLHDEVAAPWRGLRWLPLWLALLAVAALLEGRGA